MMTRPVPLKAGIGLLFLGLIACSGCSGCSGARGEGASGEVRGGTSYAPYVNATTGSATDRAGSPSAYNLSFVVADGDRCAPVWDDRTGIGEASVKSRIRKLSSTGADVRVSFGGATDKELAVTCGSAAALAAAYAKALDAAGGATLADFDIEGDALADRESTALRAEAIALLQKRRDLDVTFTLPVMPSGLDADSVALLEAANDKGVQVSTVNLMTMNYSESHDGDMGGYAITAARAAHTQLKKVFGLSDAGAWKGMALTSMLGVNDVDGETFTLSDAAQVRTFARQRGIAWVSMWATFRDVQCKAGAATQDPATDCSGVKQGPGAYARALSG
ncbi:chitinase [Streptomyces sp. NPDC102467]|uniref:chitinase n=1 Tax=Streptomyces sp. NPDC102467 TaxID=3366179 RepID=UPI00382AD6D1